MSHSAPPRSLLMDEHRPKTNAECQRAYYKRNKQTICFRKIMNRVRKEGAIPLAQTCITNQVPLQAVLCAFAEWAGSNGDLEMIRRQKKKLDRLRIVLRPQADPTEQERKTLVYLRRLTHPHVL